MPTNWFHCAASDATIRLSPTSPSATICSRSGSHASSRARSEAGERLRLDLALRRSALRRSSRQPVRPSRGRAVFRVAGQRLEQIEHDVDVSQVSQRLAQSPQRSVQRRKQFGRRRRLEQIERRAQPPRRDAGVVDRVGVEIVQRLGDRLPQVLDVRIGVATERNGGRS
jgi:hypothetical protein